MIEIREGAIEQAVGISQQLPEFIEPYPAEVYHERLSQVPSLILIAFVQSQAVGMKVGYERDLDGSFYSWMGGVLPSFRKKGIAQMLAEVQKEWAKAQGYTSIRFKTLNRHKAMQIFALKQGFDIIQIEQRTERADYSIWMEKQL